MTDAKDIVCKITDGLRFVAGPESWWLDPLTVPRGGWVALVPDGADPAVDPAGNLARVLASLLPPLVGTVEILGRNLYRLPYREVQRLRARFGFVQGYGGLLSNRTIRENIALPLSVHGGLSVEDEERRLDEFLARFSLVPVANLKPHDMDGATRWRACVVRSLVLDPDWLVLEGIGDWEMDRGSGASWRGIVDYHRRGIGAAAVCLSRRNPEFESWFVEQGGVVLKYSKGSGALSASEGRA